MELEEDKDVKNRTSSKQLKVENLTKWVESIQEDSDVESDIGYFTSEGTDAIDDRDIARCAIAVAKASAKKGIVSLCTYIARILKQNAKLRRKVQHLRNQLKETEKSEVITQQGASGRLLELASESLGQISGAQGLPFKDKNSKNKSLEAEALNLVDLSRKVESPKRRTLPITGNVILTEAIVHHSAQSPSTDQYKEFLPSQSPVRSQKSTSVTKTDEDRPIEKHQSRVLLSQSLNASPERPIYQVMNKSKSLNASWSPSSGSPKLTSIYEDLPLDISRLEALSTDQTTRSPPKISKTICCEDTGQECQCALLWIDKYSEMCRRLKKMEIELDILREKVHNPRNVNGRPNESSADRTSNSNITEEPKCSVEEQTGHDVTPDNDSDWLTRLTHQNLTPLMAPSPLKGCKCTQCELAVQQEELKAVDKDEIEVFELVYKGKPLLEVSALVMIPGDTIARVAYVGHLDSTEMPAAVFVGVIVEKPIGNSNGRNGGKPYFQCEPKHGIFMPINQILFVVSPAIEASQDPRKKIPVRKQRSYSHS